MNFGKEFYSDKTILQKVQKTFLMVLLLPVTSVKVADAGAADVKVLLFVFSCFQNTTTQMKMTTTLHDWSRNNTTMLNWRTTLFSPRRWKMNNLIGEISSGHPLPRPCLCWNLSHVAGHITKYVVRHFVCWWSKERRRPFQNSRQRRLSGKPSFKISIFRQIQLLNQSCQAIKHTIDHVNLLSSIIRKRDIYFNCRMSTMQTFLRT